MSQFRFGLLATAAIAAALSGAAHADTITFEDVGVPNSFDVPNGYGGLDWDTFSVSDNTKGPTDVHPHGDVGGGSVIAFNPNGYPAKLTTASTPFTFDGAYLTSFWMEDLQLDLVGKLDGVVVYSATLDLRTDQTTHFLANWIGVDELDFTAHGGTPDPTLASTDGIGEQFALDDLSVTFPRASAAPEPAAWALMITGFGLAGATLRRRPAGFSVRTAG